MLNIEIKKIRYLTETYIWQDVVTDTTAEYSQSSSVHGIQYIFEGGTNLLASRIIWIIIVLIFAILGIVWSVEVSGKHIPKSIGAYQKIS